jgi:flavin reductase (DIM6/NTAB) family NADH-FMN oxidoreductase RutF
VPRVEVDYRDHFRLIAEGLQHGGLMLVAVGADGRANPMTIGWAFAGPAWGRQVFVALVRPSRYTYGLMEETGDFTVNVLPAGFERALSYCGSESGRDGDKLAAAGLSAIPGLKGTAPSLAEAILSLECRVVEKTDLNPDTMVAAVRQMGYPKGDFHRLYFGEIVAAYGDPNRLG